MVEIWKNIIGYEGHYQVSNMGQVKSLNYNRTLKERILKGGKGGGGYYQVNLFKNGKIKRYYVHRLVGIAFIPNPENKPEINHIDGNKANNIVNNLEWVTSKQNTEHAFETGLRDKYGFRNIDNKGEKHGRSKLTESQVLEIRDKYSTGKYTHRGLANDYSVSHTAIGKIINRKRWSHLK